MSGEGRGWGGGVGRPWGESYWIRGEVDPVKDLHRSEEWSDISEDESPPASAEPPNTEKWQEAAVQSKGPAANSIFLSHESSIAIDASEDVSPQDETKTFTELSRVTSSEPAFASTSYPVVYPSLAPYPSEFPQMPTELRGAGMVCGETSVEVGGVGVQDREWWRNAGAPHILEQTFALPTVGPSSAPSGVEPSFTRPAVEPFAALRHQDLYKNPWQQYYPLEDRKFGVGSTVNQHGPLANIPALHDSPSKSILPSAAPYATGMYFPEQQPSYYFDTPMMPVPHTSMFYPVENPQSLGGIGHSRVITSVEQPRPTATVLPSVSVSPTHSYDEGKDEISQDTFALEPCKAKPCDNAIRWPSVGKIDVLDGKLPPTISNNKGLVQHSSTGNSGEGILNNCAETCADVKIEQHTTRTVAESEREVDRDDAKLGVRLFETLKKQKRKLGRPPKKNTILKIAELLEIVGEDSRNTPSVNKATDAKNKHKKRDDDYDDEQYLAPHPLPYKSNSPPAFTSQIDVKELALNTNVSPTRKPQILLPAPTFSPTTPTFSPTTFEDKTQRSNIEEDCLELQKQNVEVTKQKTFDVGKEPIVTNSVESHLKAIPVKKTEQLSSDLESNKSSIKTDLRTEDCTNVLQGSLDIENVDLKEPLHPARADAVSSRQKSSKLQGNCEEVDRKPHMTDSIAKEHENSAYSCVKTSPLRLTDSLSDSLSENLLSPKLHKTSRLSKKLKKRLSVISRMANHIPCPQQNLSDSKVTSPQKKLENVTTEGELNKAIKMQLTKPCNKQKIKLQSGGKSNKVCNARSKRGLMGHQNRVQKKQELPSEIRDVDISQDEAHTGPGLHAHEKPLNCLEDSRLETSTKTEKLGRQGRGPKRKGKKRKLSRGRALRCKTSGPTAKPDKMMLLETQRPQEISKRAARQKTKTFSKKRAVKVERQQLVTKMDSDIIPEENLSHCSNKHLDQTLSSPPPFTKKTSIKEKFSNPPQNGSSLTNGSLVPISCPDALSQNTSSHSSLHSTPVDVGFNCELSLNANKVNLPKKASKTKISHLNSLEAPVRVFSEDPSLLSNNINHCTPSSPQNKMSSVKSKVYSKNDEKLEAANQNAIPQGPPLQHKGQRGRISKRKRKVSKVASNFKELANKMVVENSKPITSTPRKNTGERSGISEDGTPQSSAPNSSFDFGEEEFHVPVIKVTSRSELSSDLLESPPKQSCREISKEDENSSLTVQPVTSPGTKFLDLSGQTGTEVPELLTDLPPLPIPPPITRPLKKQVGRKRKRRISLKQPIKLDNVPQQKEKDESIPKADTQECNNTESEPLPLPLSISKCARECSTQRKSQSRQKQPSAQSDPQDLMENEKDEEFKVQAAGKSTAIKTEQAEFALSAINMGSPIFSEEATQISSITTTKTSSPPLPVKRKLGRPPKKKTLLKLAKILAIVQESEDASSKGAGIKDYVDSILQTNQQARLSRVKKESASKPVSAPSRRSLRAVVTPKVESSLLSACKNNTDSEHKVENGTPFSETLCRQSSSGMLLSETPDPFENTSEVNDQQDPVIETRVETKSLRFHKKPRRRKSLYQKKTKMVPKELCQQVVDVSSTQTEVVLSGNKDAVPAASEKMDVEAEVTPLPVPSDRVNTFCLSAFTSKALFTEGRKSVQVSLNVLQKSKFDKFNLKSREKSTPDAQKDNLANKDSSDSIDFSQTSNDEERHSDYLKAQSSTAVKQKFNRRGRQKISLRKLNSTAIVQVPITLSKSLSKMESLQSTSGTLMPKMKECKKPVSIAPPSKLRRSLRGASSTSQILVGRKRRKPSQSGHFTKPSSVQVESKRKKMSKAAQQAEKTPDVGNDKESQKHSDNFNLSNEKHEKLAPIPAQEKLKRGRRGRKRKSNCTSPLKNQQLMERNNSSAHAVDDHYSVTSVEQENVLKRNQSPSEKTGRRGQRALTQSTVRQQQQSNMEKTLNVVCDEGNVHVKSESHLASSELNSLTPQQMKKKMKSETPLRRSFRASKTASLFYRVEGYTTTDDKATDSTQENNHIVAKAPDKDVEQFTKRQTKNDVPADSAEILNSTEIDQVSKHNQASNVSLNQSEETNPTKLVDPIVEAQHLVNPAKRRGRKPKSSNIRKKLEIIGSLNAVQILQASSDKVISVEKENCKPKPNVTPKNDTELEDKQMDRQMSELVENESIENTNPSHERTLMITNNVLVSSSCQTSLSVHVDSSTQIQVETVDGYTQCNLEDSTSQHLLVSASQKVIKQAVKNDKTSIKCKFCGRLFRHFTAYNVHQRLHSGEKPFQCKHCGKQFAKLLQLKYHRNVHNTVASIQCPCCNSRFSTKDKLITHFKVHLKSTNQAATANKSRSLPSKNPTGHNKTMNNVFKCSVCSEEFPTEPKLCFHQSMHNGEPLSCQVCGQTFHTLSGLGAHERIHWPLKPYACSICGKGFDKLRPLKAHSLEHSGETPFFCSHCGYSSSDLAELRAHQASRICSFKRQDNIEGFLIQLGMDGQVNTPNLFKCHLCKKLLNHWCQYSLHLRTHMKAHPYLCDACGQSYERESDVRVHCKDCCKASGEEKACTGSLSDIWKSTDDEDISELAVEPGSPEHMDEHCVILHNDSFFSANDSPAYSGSGETSPAHSDDDILSSSLDCYIVSSTETRPPKRFECKHCGQIFRLSSLLKAHLQKHFSGIRYNCGLCGLSFQKWHKLWLHQRIHQGKGRSFWCLECKVQFRFLGAYKRHLWEHVQQKPYGCPLCSDTFLKEELLRAHQLEFHKPNRTLQCDICAKRFSNFRNCVKHSLLHNCRSSHTCLICERSYANSHSLQAHLKTHNNNLCFPTTELPSEPLLFPHQCWCCTASFSKAELLSAHLICHAVGGKLPPRPKDTFTAQENTDTSDVTRAPPTPIPEPVLPQHPVPEISEEHLFDFAHPDSLYVVPDSPLPLPMVSPPLSPSGHLTPPQDPTPTGPEATLNLCVTTDTSENAPNTSQTISNATSNEEGILPQISSTESQADPVLSPVLKSSTTGTTPLVDLAKKTTFRSEPNQSQDGLNEKVKSFSITVEIQDTSGIECLVCHKTLPGVEDLHKHYLEHATGVC